MKQVPFEMDLVIVKDGKEHTFSGDSCLTDFTAFGKENLDKIGWRSSDRFIIANLVDGSFDLDGKIVNIDLGLIGADEYGNTRAIPMSELDIEPIWFRRVRQDTAPTGVTITCKYCVGWKVNVNGKVHQKIALIDFKSGDITISDRK